MHVMHSFFVKITRDGVRGGSMARTNQAYGTRVGVSSFFKFVLWSFILVAAALAVCADGCDQEPDIREWVFM